MSIVVLSYFKSCALILRSSTCCSATGLPILFLAVLVERKGA